jgi:hypothetical protein
MALPISLAVSSQSCMAILTSRRALSSEIEKFALCALKILTTGPDPLMDRIRLVAIALPNNAVYIIDCLEPEFEILSSLACLLENCRIRKVLFDAKTVISFFRVAIDRKLNACNLFDLMLASQICWSGFHYLAPSNWPLSQIQSISVLIRLHIFSS